MSILDALRRLRDQRILEGLDPDNPTCPGCGERRDAADLKHEGGICAVCADDELERRTGSRF